MDAVKLAKQLKIHEGYRETTYLDTAGNRTVGVGFNLERGDAELCLRKVDAKYSEVLAGRSKLNSKQIGLLLACGIVKAERTAKRIIRNYNELDEVRQRVIVDMVFNMGDNTILQFERDTAEVKPDDTPASEFGLIDLIEAHRYKEAVARMLKTKWAKQVGNRARALSRMMETGEDTYDI